MPDKQEDNFSPEEAARRRDEVIKRMLSMPPKPHSEMKVKKSAPKRGKGSVKKRRAPSASRSAT